MEIFRFHLKKNKILSTRAVWKKYLHSQVNTKNPVKNMPNPNRVEMLANHKSRIPGGKE